MKRWLYCSELASGPLDALEETLREQLPQLLRAATDTPGPEDPPEADGSFALRLSARGFVKTTVVEVGVASRTRVGDLHIPIRWRARPGAPFFPHFEGAIELEQMTRVRALVSLFGSYAPPLGPLGAGFDAVVLAGMATDTAQRLVSGLARQLSLAINEPPVAQSQQDAGGRLLRVGDLLTPDPVALRPDMSLRDAASLLARLDIGGAPVVDDDGRLLGVLSDRDLIEKEATRRYGLGRSARESERRRRARVVDDACSRPARTTVPGATVHDAARAMLDHDVARLIVVDQSRVAGIITRRDVLRALLRSDSELSAAVKGLLTELGQDGITATVEAGEATLTGRATLRSRIPEITERVAEIDGVTTVQGDLDWIEDDATPIPPVFLT